MAVAITATLQDQNPVVLSVLQGGLYPNWAVNGAASDAIATRLCACWTLC